MKILELFNNSVKLLDNVGIKTSKLDAKILLAHLLNIDSKELILHFNKNVKQEFIDNFNSIKDPKSYKFCENWHNVLATITNILIIDNVQMSSGGI